MLSNCAINAIKEMNRVAVSVGYELLYAVLFILQSAEAAKLQPVNKDKERMQEASQKAQELSEAFSKETEKKLSEKMEVSQENKNAQMLAKQERLKEHVCFTYVCNCSDSSNR